MFIGNIQEAVITAPAGQQGTAISNSWSLRLIQTAHRLVSVIVHIYSECMFLTVAIKRYYLGELLLSKVALAILIKRLNMNIL